MPGGVITLQDSLDLRRSSRLKNEYVLAIPITHLDAHQTSSLNSIRRTWNNTPVELRRINNIKNFKNAVKSANAYDTLLQNGEYRRMEESI